MIYEKIRLFILFHPYSLLYRKYFKSLDIDFMEGRGIFLNIAITEKLETDGSHILVWCDHIDYQLVAWLTTRLGQDIISHLFLFRDTHFRRKNMPGIFLQNLSKKALKFTFWMKYKKTSLKHLCSPLICLTRLYQPLFRILGNRSAAAPTRAAFKPFSFSSRCEDWLSQSQLWSCINLDIQYLACATFCS